MVRKFYDGTIVTGNPFLTLTNPVTQNNNYYTFLRDGYITNDVVTIMYEIYYYPTDYIETGSATTVFYPNAPVFTYNVLDASRFSLTYQFEPLV
jgi:hypothetical protein